MTENITLRDGRQLECYPRSIQSIPDESNKLSLDSTGEYLQIGTCLKRPKSPTRNSVQRAKEARLFYGHISLFLANAEKILSNSKMFFAPVSVVNALAYTGTSGLSNPTLGVYIEWWLNNKDERCII